MQKRPILVAAGKFYLRRSRGIGPTIIGSTAAYSAHANYALQHFIAAEDNANAIEAIKRMKNLPGTKTAKLLETHLGKLQKVFSDISLSEPLHSIVREAYAENKQKIKWNELLTFEGFEQALENARQKEKTNLETIGKIASSPENKKELEELAAASATIFSPYQKAWNKILHNRDSDDYERIEQKFKQAAKKAGIPESDHDELFDALVDEGLIQSLALRLHFLPKK